MCLGFPGTLFVDLAVLTLTGDALLHQVISLTRPGSAVCSHVCATVCGLSLSTAGGHD